MPPGMGLPPDGGLPPFDTNPQPGGLNVPGGDEKTPGFPGLPPDPGGFNPAPGLPTDLNLPDTLKKDEKSPLDPLKDSPSPLDKNSGNYRPTELNSNLKPVASKMDIKPEPAKKDAAKPSSKRKAETSELKSNLPIRLPEIKPTKTAEENMQAANQIHPQANWDSALQPGSYAESSRSGINYPSTDYARQTDYEAPIEAEGNARYSGEVVQQSFQQSQSRDIPSIATADLRQAGNPPMAMKGYCPVELSRNGRWVQGDPRWTAIHQGIIYRLSGEEQRQQFLAHPEQFVPGNAGNDPVISVTEQRNVPGELNYCAAFKGRLYMFNSPATQAEFQKHPEQFLGGK
jgi:YHS domain-containing protein